MKFRGRLLLGLAVTGLTLAAGSASAMAATSTVVYDNFNSPYTLANYNSKWTNPYGLGDMGVAPGDTRTFVGNVFHINDAPFRTSFDFSVYDHLKYIAVSNQQFPVPAPGGTVMFSSLINAKTPGAQPGRVITGTYGPPGSYPTPPNGAPYTASTFEGQQAGAVMNMINFQTGQLFDWFISGSHAFTLVERLPSSVTGNTSDPSSPDWVGPGKMYTQIANEFAVKPGAHRVGIRYGRSATDPNNGTVEFVLDGAVITTIDHVGMPLDSPTRATLGATVPWTGVYSSATYPGGPVAVGQDLGGKIDGFVIGHGTFSLLDAFPFQWGWFDSCPSSTILACGGSVSIPTSQRLFGQGAKATFDDFTVTTTMP